MDFREDITQTCAYFYEVLVKKYLELEDVIHKQSGLRSIFKKINYMDRANAFDSLRERAVEAKKNFPSLDDKNSDYQAYSLSVKLTECLSIYINMVESLIQINTVLHRKANNDIKLNLNEHLKNNKYFEMLRGNLESELPKLQSLYSFILKDKKYNADTKNEVDEKELADSVISEYLSSLESNFSTILETLLDMGIDKDAFEDEGWIKYDIFLCGMTIDAMALFNLLNKEQANRIFKYISYDRFLGLDNEEQRDYSINEVAEYKNLWDKATKEIEPPFDFVFSKLLQNFLGENISNYNINPLHMMQIISLVLPIFAGKWKKVLEEYSLIQV